MKKAKNKLSKAPQPTPLATLPFQFYSEDSTNPNLQSPPTHNAATTRKKSVVTHERLESSTSKCNSRKRDDLDIYAKTSHDLKRRNQRIAQCNKSFIIVEHKQTQKVSAVKHRCNSYSCETCVKEKRRKILAAAYHFAEQNKECVMMTLTLQRDIFSNDKKARACESARYINSCWKRFRALLWKRGIRIKFFKVIEFTKAAVAHIHCMCSHMIDKHIVKALWKVATKFTSYQVCIGIKNKSQKTIRSKAAADYLVKYVCKMTSEQLDALYMTATRLYSYSKNMLLGQFTRLRQFYVHDFCIDEREAERRCAEIRDTIKERTISFIITNEPLPF